MVNGAGGEIAQQLIAHPDCAKVSFTGSVATGESPAFGNIVRKTRYPRTRRENAALFLNDLTAQAMVNGILEAGYLNQGQICAAAGVLSAREKLDTVMTLLRQRLSEIVPAPFR